MTEAEYLAAKNPTPMLEFLGGGNPLRPECPAPPPSSRKLRLFACACCRAEWDRLTDPRSRRAVEVAERFADGLATPAEMRAARVQANEPPCDTLAPQSCPRCLAVAAAAVRVEDFRSIITPFASPGLVRDLFGNPFRPVEPEECYLDDHYCRTHGRDLAFVAPGLYRCPDGRAAFRATLATPAVQGIARRAYDCQDFAALPVLADALEEAGCEDGPLLRHLRTDRDCPGCGRRWDCLPDDRRPGCPWCGQVLPRQAPHARGCWALDVVLGKS